MPKTCEHCGGIDCEIGNQHKIWCITRTVCSEERKAERSPARLHEATTLAQQAAARYPMPYMGSAHTFYPHAWVVEAVAAVLEDRDVANANADRQNNRRILAEERSKAHSATIAELTEKLENERTAVDRMVKEIHELGTARDRERAAAKTWAAQAQSSLDQASEINANRDNEIVKLRAKLTYQDERETVHSRTIAELTYGRDTMFRELQALREATMLDPPENDWGKLTPAHVRQHVQDLADRVEQLTRERAAAWDVQVVVARCETAERENERLTADVAQLRATTAADGEQIVEQSRRADLAAARCETWQREFDEREKQWRDAAGGRFMVIESPQELAETMRTHRAQIDEYRGHLLAIGDIATERTPGFPAIVAAVRKMSLDLADAKREIAEMGEEMARDVEPDAVAAAATELAACPRCEVEPLSRLEHCERCGVCNTCANTDQAGCGCDTATAKDLTFDWQSIAHRLFAAACPQLAPTANLAAEPDRWISEVTSARRVRDIAHADNAKLVQQAKELAARLDETRRDRGDVVNNYSAIEGVAMVDGTPPLRAAIVERVAQLIAAKVLG